MSQLFNTWPGMATRDVFLGAVGGLVATSGSDGIFGSHLPRSDLSILFSALVILMLLYLGEEVLVNLLGYGDTEECRGNTVFHHSKPVNPPGYLISSFTVIGYEY